MYIFDRFCIIMLDAGYQFDLGMEFGFGLMAVKSAWWVSSAFAAQIETRSYASLHMKSFFRDLEALCEYRVITLKHETIKK